MPHACAPWRQDQYERVLLNLYVKPDRPVVSYLTPLTGCDTSGACLERELCLCSKHRPHLSWTVCWFIGYLLARDAEQGAAVGQALAKELRTACFSNSSRRSVLRSLLVVHKLCLSTVLKLTHFAKPGPVLLSVCGAEDYLLYAGARWWFAA